MKVCHTLCFAFLLASAGSQPLLGQAANDECSTALPLDDVTNWCSGDGAFSNANASQSNLLQASCFPDVTNDLWFSFVAEANTVQVTVIGNTSGNPGPGGTLENPQFAIYSGDCNGTLTEIACASDGFGTHIVESFAGPLTVGETYYVRVDGRDGQTGTFRLCINNYNAVPDPSSDCPTGVILCDKSPFTVESLVGTGALNNEIGPGVCVQVEYASAWYRWTCKDAGTLTFTITPSNPSDDIDFAVFELPDGIDDCGDKVKVRCMASGENVGQPFPNWSICTGPTGLSEDETDLDEFPGCAPGQNNFVAALNMVPGKSYALIVNNFSNTGSGFQIEFGGSGTFQGPEADFTSQPQPVCEKNTITFEDASTSIEGITDWAWNFGIGASPATANGPGPHQVKYSTPGIRSVTLTITSESGCIITKIRQINALPLPDVSFEVVADYCGPDDLTGAISLQPAGQALPYTYDWQGSGVFVADSTLSNLEFGSYSVIVQDANGCKKEFDIGVPEGLSLSAGVDPVNPPTCNGDADGSISISIQIANNPVLFDFGNGLQSSNTLSNIPAGTYNVYAVDAAGCEGQFTIEVTDFPPLVVALDITDISCNGANDGTITAIVSGGAGGYSYAWSNGETDETIDNLTAGLYSITVTDANGCNEVNAGDIIEPEPLDFTFSVVDVICAGEATGVISVSAAGGTPPYEYSADGVLFQGDPNLSGLLAGEYQVQVRDAPGCILAKTVLIAEPLPLVAEAGPDQTVDLGYAADLQGFVTPPFLPVTLAWSPAATLSCTDCLDPVASPVETTTYYLTVEDEVGCRATDSVTVTVLLKRPVYIPNVFTPNADGLNDFFAVYGGPAARSIRSLKVFTRWGSLVFEGYDLPLNQESSGWDGYFKGKIMDPSVFAYVAEVEFIDGAVVLHEGDVTILR